MKSATQTGLKVADEVWISTALLHRKHPSREDFSIDEIVHHAQEQGLSDVHRPGVYVHTLQHCVANRPPNAGRYCMLFETAKGRRRLWRPGDRVDPRRIGGKRLPSREHIPASYHHLLDWYESKYGKPTAQITSVDPILGLRGLWKDVWRGENPDKYVQRVREGWE